MTVAPARVFFDRRDTAAPAAAPPQRRAQRERHQRDASRSDGHPEQLESVVAQDLRALGVDDSAIEHITIVRSPFAYPICDPARDAGVARVRDFLRRDHAMLSAMRSVARYFGADVDPWRVNTDRGYHEVGLLKK